MDVQLNNRHMLIRGENVSKILRVRSTVTQCFRDHFFSRGYYEVTHTGLTFSQRSLSDLRSGPVGRAAAGHVFHLQTAAVVQVCSFS